jgi:hypothetical protein
MAGAKNLTLLDKRGQQHHKRFRYKKLRSAVRRAEDLLIGEGKYCQIYDLEREEVLAAMVKDSDGVHLLIVKRNTFNALWAKGA